MSVNFRKYAIVCLAFMLGMLVSQIAAQDISIGLLGEPSGPEAEEAYDWAEANYDAAQIALDANLKQFAIVWWHEGTDSAIPPEFLANQVMDNIDEYVSSGGSLLLTGVAFHYVFDLGIESTEPRVYAAGTAEHNMDLVPADGMDEHPIFDDLEIPIAWHVIDYCASSDFYGTPGPEDGEVLVESVTYPDDHPVCEYSVGAGTIIIMGWIIPTWADESADDNRPLVEQFTGNALNYLAENSEYSSVDSNGKLPVIWGELKR